MKTAKDISGTTSVGLYIGIGVMLDFFCNQKGIGVIIISRAEKLLHKNTALYPSLLSTLYATYAISSLHVRMLIIDGLKSSTIGHLRVQLAQGYNQAPGVFLTKGQDY